MQINRDQLDSHLKNTKRGELVFFIKAGEKVARKIYYTGYRNGKHWANTSGGMNNFSTDVVIFPSKMFNIIKVGQNTVESKENFADRKAAYKQLQKDAKRGLIVDAYKHSKLCLMKN